MAFIQNRWYLAGWSHEVMPGPGGAPKPLGRKICGEDVVIWRTATMKLVILADYCPHRLAPLSYGDVIGEDIKCRYHGLRFNSEGRCSVDPSGAKPPPMQIKSYPVAERDGGIYVWIGQGEPDRPAPDWLDLGQEYGGALRDHLVVKANYKFIVDNLQDDAHATHLHTLLETEAHIARPKTEVIDNGEEIKSITQLKDTSVIPFFRALRKKPGNVDQFIHLTWKAPSTINIHVGVYDVDGDPADNQGINSAHIITPESENSTHYFWCFERNAGLDNHSLTGMMQAQLKHIFTTEDAWMAEGQQRVLGDRNFWDAKPAMMLQDKTAVLTRRRIEELEVNSNA